MKVAGNADSCNRPRECRQSHRAQIGGAAGDLSGKIVVDCTNPIGPGLQLLVCHHTSGAEELARVLPWRPRVESVLQRSLEEVLQR
jgi:predicted dinucleotide-binding enzyme